MGYRKRESARRRNRVFSTTADKTNLQNVKLKQPRGGRCL